MSQRKFAHLALFICFNFLEADFNRKRQTSFGDGGALLANSEFIASLKISDVSDAIGELINNLDEPLLRLRRSK